MSHFYCAHCKARNNEPYGCGYCGRQGMLNDCANCDDHAPFTLEGLSIPLDRPTFPAICLDLATSLARRSTCKRLQVGAVITTLDHRQVLAWGYNGNASGLANGCDSTEPGRCGCLHAEMNAIINCVAPRDVGKLIYLTDSPCMMCTKAIINLGGVHEVSFRRPYRDQEPVSILLKAGIMWRCAP